MKLWLPALLLVASFALVGPLPCAAQSSDDTPPASAPAAPVAEPAPSSDAAPTTSAPIEPVAEPAPSAPSPDVALATSTPVEPVAVRAAQTVPAEPVATTVPVALTSADERVLLHRTNASVDGDRAFTFVCLLPCTAELAPGSYRFGATRGSDDPRAISEVVEIDRPGEWNVRFSDNSGLRDAGWGIALTGAVAVAVGPLLGIVVFPRTIFTSSGRYTTMNTELMLAFVFPGSAAMIAGLLLGLFSYDGVIVDESGVRF